MKCIPTIQELTGEIDNIFKAVRNEALKTAKAFWSMRSLCSTENEWADFWRHSAPTDDPCSITRANLLIKCAERFGYKPVDDLTPDEIEELDQAFWSI